MDKRGAPMRPSEHVARGTWEMPSSNTETCADPFVDRSTTEPVVLGSSADEHVLGPGSCVSGRYRLRRSLGEGGMGQVFEAEDLGLGRSVALKILRASRASGSESLERFEREARALARLSGPHVVRVFDFGHLEDGRPFLSMELLQGADLRARMRQGPIAPSLSVRWIRQACTGLGEAHEAGVVHRDVKPENLFLAEMGDGPARVRLIDFGIAKELEPLAASAADLTANTLVLGSPAYMSPEQLRSPHSVGPATDVWSLGVVLYELLAGAPPFAGESDAGLVAAIAADAPLPLRERSPSTRIPRGLETVVLSCLAKDPGGRPASARALSALLQRFEGREAAPRLFRPTTFVVGAALALSMGGVWVRLGNGAGVPIAASSPPSPGAPAPSSKPLPSARTTERSEASNGATHAESDSATSVLAKAPAAPVPTSLATTTSRPRSTAAPLDRADRERVRTNGRLGVAPAGPSVAPPPRGNIDPADAAIERRK